LKYKRKNSFFQLFAGLNASFEPGHFLSAPVFFVKYWSILGSILEYFGYNTGVFWAQYWNGTKMMVV
jgi:hypothetical protein